MATITSAASGNWSNTATWVGGVVPSPGDTVILNHQVNTDVDIDLITIQTAGAVGFLNITTSRNLTNLSYNGTINNSGGGVFRTSSTSLLNTVTITGTFVVTGNNASIFIRTNSPVNLIMTGSVTFTANAESYICDFPSQTNFTFTGTVNNFGTSGHFVFFRNINGTYNVNGTFTNQSTILIRNGSGTVTGTVRGISSTINSNSFQATTLNISGVHSTTGIFLFNATNVRVLQGENLEIVIPDTSNTPTSLYTVGALTTFPTTSNVRNGVTYASGALTGTLVVPPANAVTAGVVYDNGTVGTAQNTAASFLTELAASTDPLAVRLQNVATVQTTGDQIAAAL